MIKNFLLKKMMQQQMKGVPQEQQDMFITMVEKNPELFQKIAAEMQAKIGEGKDQMAAAMEVMPKYQAEIQSLMKKDS